MPDKLTHGALSHHAKGVYICEACGMDEALRDWAGNTRPLSEWVLVKSICEIYGEKAMDEILSLNGPWFNATCTGYCIMAMQRIGLSEKTQQKMVDEMIRCFDDVSVEDVKRMKF